MVKKSTKIVLSLEALFVMGVFSYFLLLVPQPIAPSSGLVIDNVGGEDFDFEFRNAKKLMISTNEEFNDPLIFREDFEIDLPPGTYYWKVKGWFREGEVRDFTIKERLVLKLEIIDEDLVIYNLGNINAEITPSNEEVSPGKSVIINTESSNHENNELIIEGKQK